MSDCERMISYDMGPEIGGKAVFVPKCPNCGRYVKPDSEIVTTLDGNYIPEPNATCSKCGRVEMLFQGFF